VKLISHAHINGNGTTYRDEYARILARGAKKRGYSHIVVGCHGEYIASSSTMNEVRKLGITPIRYTELALTVYGNSHNHSHVALLNIPEKPIKGYSKTNMDLTNIFDYINETNCKLVLCHPRDLQEIQAWSKYIHGYEIMNGEDRYSRHWKNRDASAYYPEMKQFIGADYHVWKAKGDMDYFTELPDDWFGNLYV